MKNNTSWLTWIVVAGLLVFAGIASAVVPLVLDEMQSDAASIAQQERGPVTASVDVSELPFVGGLLVDIGFVQEYIQGKTISLLQAFGIIVAASLVGLGALTLPLAGITLFFSRQLNKVYSDESFLEASSEIERREKEYLKEMAEAQPPKSEESIKRSAFGSILVLDLLITFLVWSTSLAISASLLEGGTWDIFSLELSATAISGIAALITAIVLLVVFIRRDPATLEGAESDNNPVNWGTIWVIVSGLIVVGIGTGIAIYFTTLG